MKKVFIWMKIVIITDCARIPSWMRTARNTRIINGENATSPIPWQVLIQMNYKSTQTFKSCGGTIINEDTILSAAHCFYSKGKVKVTVYNRPCNVIKLVNLKGIFL